MAVAQASASSDEQRLVNLINAERAAVGVPELIVVPDLVAGAEGQAARMADAGTIFHNQNLGDITSGWQMLGENVGMGGTVDGLHQAFMNSSGHRANILNPAYDGVGVGVVWKAGIPYVSEVFMDPIEPLPGQYTPPFYDDDGSIFESDIITIFNLGITKGCASNRYCPDDPVTRGEMAAMLVRAFDIPRSGSDLFADDNSSVFEADINALAAAGVTMGCAPDRYCPDRRISRGEMAIFLTRVLDLPSAPPAGFTDTAGNMAASAIDSLAAAEITKGCTSTTFCPDANVTRGQMAAFLVRALER
jgi:hypothetical protein